VAGTDDQIDVMFTVEEQPSGSISATFGYAQGTGLLLGASYSDTNVLGTGNSLSFGINWSDFQRSIAFNFFDPYYTLDGISRGFNAFYRETDFDERNIATYSTDAFGAGVSFGFPIGETERIDFSLNLEHTRITEGVFPAQEISAFLRDEGKTALNYKLSGSITSSTLNRGLFATAGLSQRLSLLVSVPPSDSRFYKVDYAGQVFVPLGGEWTVRLSSNLGFGDAIGGGERFPFYEHYFAGGFDTVRGFETNTLGPRSTPSEIDPYDNQGDPFGGNLLIVGRVELLFPLPFVKDRSAVRPAFFFDAGQVFNTHCPDVSVSCLEFDRREFRFSAGVGVTWLSGFGPLTFALSKPMNGGPLDEEESFQFELGQSF
jgi:outer membrane protein insertion porin family